MNIKITKEHHEELSKIYQEEYIFGSQLHGIATKDSDKDYIRIYDLETLAKEAYKTCYIHLPNIHSFQYDDVENNTQYVYMTYEQFWRNLWSGDGNMVADVVLLSGEWSEPMSICRTYNIIKGYLGMARRDLKLHGNKEKKRFHAFRSLMMAEKLINNQQPSIQDIRELKNRELPSKEILSEKEKNLRGYLNEMLDNNDITRYPIAELPESNTLLELMFTSNNTKEFKYD